MKRYCCFLKNLLRDSKDRHLIQFVDFMEMEGGGDISPIKKYFNLITHLIKLYDFNYPNIVALYCSCILLDHALHILVSAYFQNIFFRKQSYSLHLITTLFRFKTLKWLCIRWTIKIALNHTKT